MLLRPIYDSLPRQERSWHFCGRRYRRRCWVHKERLLESMGAEMEMLGNAPRRANRCKSVLTLNNRIYQMASISSEKAMRIELIWIPDLESLLIYWGAWITQNRPFRLSFHAFCPNAFVRMSRKFKWRNDQLSEVLLSHLLPFWDAWRATLRGFWGYFWKMSCQKT